MPDTDILIAGAGLAGLRLGGLLHDAGRDVRIVEARARVGGRILTHAGSDTDLGPSWFWPGQPRIAALAQELGLPVFEQHAAGKLVYQDAAGAVRRDLDMAPMAGALRIAGGMTALTDALATRLEDGVLALGHRLVSLSRRDGGIDAKLIVDGRETVLSARAVVLAVPPRVIAGTIAFDPPLSDQAHAATLAIPTWMAGHAKAVAIYDSPFWRAEGLSGDAISHIGPLAEIHDASPADGSCGALFGFFGVPASLRRDHADVLEDAVREQLGKLFGPEACAAHTLLLQDWAAEPLTATALDEVPPAGHPAYGMPPALRDLWEGSLILASTEMAPQFGGFLEGALEAAEQAERFLRR